MPSQEMASDRESKHFEDSEQSHKLAIRAQNHTVLGQFFPTEKEKTKKEESSLDPRDMLSSNGTHIRDRSNLGLTINMMARQGEEDDPDDYNDPQYSEAQRRAIEQYNRQLQYQLAHRDAYGQFSAIEPEPVVSNPSRQEQMDAIRESSNRSRTIISKDEQSRL